MGIEKFKQGLVEMGFEVADSGDGNLIIDYQIQDGKFKDTVIKLGFVVPGDFEMNPPSGPHINPRLIPFSDVAEHCERMATSSFGLEWGYLSRPFQNWGNTNRSVREYMRYIKHLLETL